VAAERLQKVLAAAGVASRRAAEAMIAAGRVTVDGKKATLGTQADPDRQIIAVDGQVIGSAAAQVYLVLHKPAGVTSTTQDRHADTTVLDLVPTALVPDGARLYPVGRLDQDSEGMLLLTNDGAWADRVLHPRHGVEREYALGLATPLDGAQADALRHGIQLTEGLATLHGLRPMTEIEKQRLEDLLRPAADPALTWYRATLTQGWKRQLRRMFGAVEAPVQRLVRVRIGPVRIDGLRSAAIRPLKAPEIRGLGAGAGRSRAAARIPTGEAPAAPGQAQSAIRPGGQNRPRRSAPRTAGGQPGSRAR
jgi:23S rRNA pseudouridine2605 synthase